MNYNYFRYVKNFTTNMLNFERFSAWLRPPLVKFANEKDPSHDAKQDSHESESLAEKIIRKGSEIKENIKEDLKQGKENVK
jgi:hypothetical protein